LAVAKLADWAQNPVIGPVGVLVVVVLVPLAGVDVVLDTAGCGAVVVVTAVVVVVTTA
jgi:hypothetical protein